MICNRVIPVHFDRIAKTENMFYIKFSESRGFIDDSLLFFISFLYDGIIEVYNYIRKVFIAFVRVRLPNVVKMFLL